MSIKKKTKNNKWNEDTYDKLIEAIIEQYAKILSENESKPPSAKLIQGTLDKGKICKVLGRATGNSTVNKRILQFTRVTKQIGDNYMHRYQILVQYSKEQRINIRNDLMTLIKNITIKSNNNRKLKSKTKKSKDKDYVTFNDDNIRQQKKIMVKS
eukprot:367321_1